MANDYRYDPWGSAQHGSTTVSNWLRWAGQMLDWHEGLYAMGARSYDPELGRFLSEDPLGLAAGINPYAYVGDSPVNGTDPSGLDCYFTWTPYPWCDEATELKVLVQGGGGGAGPVGGYGGSSATGLGGAGDGAGPNSGFAAFGLPGGGGFAATAAADTFDCSFSPGFLRQGNEEWNNSNAASTERGGWYGPPWDRPLRNTIQDPSMTSGYLLPHPGSSGNWHAHIVPRWLGGNPGPSGADIVWVRRYQTTMAIFGPNDTIYVVTPGDMSTTACGWPH